MLLPYHLHRLQLGLTVAVVAGCGGGDVTVPQTTGTLEITTSTSGAEQDADGYSVQMDAGTARAIGAAATLTMSDATPGNHTVQLGEVAANCTVAGDNPRPVSVTAGQTATISFAVTCTGTTGSVKVTPVTTGGSRDANGYAVSMDGGAAQSIDFNGSLTISGLTLGDHSVALAGVASNCAVEGPNPRTVPVRTGVEATVIFAVTCAAAAASHWANFPLPEGFSVGAVWASSATDVIVVGGRDPWIVGGNPYDHPSADASVQHYDGRRWIEQLRAPVRFLSGSSPTNVFAAGAGHVWRYDGTRWTGGPAGLIEPTYMDIWASSPGDVFVVGSEEASTRGIALINHYDGTSWSSTNAGFSDEGSLLYSISGTSPMDVFAVGIAPAPSDTPPEFYGYQYRVMHYDGHSWSKSFAKNIFNAQPSVDDFIPTAVWAVAPNDVFLVCSAGRILHFDGISWTPMTSPTSQDLADVWGDSGSNVYAVGDGGILRYDGMSWTVINTTAGARVWGAGTDVFVITKDRAAILHGTP